MTTTSVPTTTRWPAYAGLAAVGLAIVGDAVGGFSSSKVSDPAAVIAASLHAHRSGLLVSAAMTGAAAALFVCLFVGLSSRIRAAGYGVLGTAVLVVMVTGNALATVPDALLQATAHIDDPSIVKAAYVTSGFFVTKALWCAALTALLVAAAGRRGVFPRWYATGSAVVAVLLPFGAIATGQGGALAEGGPVTLVAFLAFMAWVVSTSVVVLRGDDGAIAPV